MVCEVIYSSLLIDSLLWCNILDHFTSFSLHSLPLVHFTGQFSPSTLFSLPSLHNHSFMYASTEKKKQSHETDTQDVHLVTYTSVFLHLTLLTTRFQCHSSFLGNAYLFIYHSVNLIYESLFVFYLSPFHLNFMSLDFSSSVSSS